MRVYEQSELVRGQRVSEWRVKVNVHKLAVSKYKNRCNTENEHLLALASVPSATVCVMWPPSFTMHHVNVSSCK